MNCFEMIKKRDVIQRHLDVLISLAVMGDINAMKEAPIVLGQLSTINADLAHADFKTVYKEPKK